MINLALTTLIAAAGLAAIFSAAIDTRDVCPPTSAVSVERLFAPCLARTPVALLGDVEPFVVADPLSEPPPTTGPHPSEPAPVLISRRPVDVDTTGSIKR